MSQAKVSARVLLVAVLQGHRFALRDQMRVASLAKWPRAARAEQMPTSRVGLARPPRASQPDWFCHNASRCKVQYRIHANMYRPILSIQAVLAPAPAQR
eukprot:233572-Pyramimonas_sp.AAC.1